MANADKADKTSRIKVKRNNKPVTVRQRMESAGSDKPRSRRIRSTAGRVGSPLKRLKVLKERKPKGLTIFGRQIRIIPTFIKDAFKEVRQVNWPNWRDTIRLTLAVFIFAVVFASFVGILDYGLGKLFKEVIIKK